MPNITMTVEADLLRKARRYAAANDTTVTGLVRGYLGSVAAKADHESETVIAQLKQIFDEGGAVIGPRRWTREELHER